MSILQLGVVERTIDRTVTNLAEGLEVAVPKLINAIVLFGLALVAITLGTRLLKRVLDRTVDPEETLVTDLVVVLVTIALWFGVGLAMLKVLGLDDIAASLGTAVGFIALGISYALSEMIEDTVSGVYLLRDPNFHVGDTIEAEDVTGEVVSIELRKTRVRIDDGSITVLANRNVESRWTQLAG